MKTILFIMLPTPSHYMTTFPLANRFLNEGFEVIFTGDNDLLLNIVEDNDFLYQKMIYQTTTLIPNIKYFFSFLIISFLSQEFLFKRYKEFYTNIMEAERLIYTSQADVVFIDEHLSHYYFYFIKQNCKVFLFNTKLLTSSNGDNPPLNTSHLPNLTFKYRIINKFLWLKVSVLHLLESLKLKFAFIGKDDTFFTKLFCKKRNINYEALVNRKNVFYYGIKNVKRIILAPEYLEPSLNDVNNTYVWLEEKRNELRYFNEEYAELKSRITNQQNFKTILCSFGTLVNENDKAVFLNRLNEAVKGENLLLIVVSKDLDSIRNKNDNVLIYPSVPQLDLLQHCDLMIHHGGFNTVKECMQFRVPMLIYALNNKGYDWLGNAARVKWRGLGVVGNIYKDSPTKIKENIKKALLIKMPKQNYEQEYVKLNRFIEENLKTN